jgi:hypothetical protein
MRDAVIVEVVRTPVGERNGGLSAVRPADLSAHVLKALVGRSASMTSFGVACINRTVDGSLAASQDTSTSTRRDFIPKCSNRPPFLGEPTEPLCHYRRAHGLG